MTPVATHIRLWLSLSLIALMAACSNAGKPSVKLTATPTSLDDGQIVTLKAEPTGGAGKITVEFYRGDVLVATDDTAPFETSLTPTSGDDATFSFSAKAIAADKQFGVSNAVSVQVKVDKEAPKVTLSTSSLKLDAVGSITLMAAATDNKGVVKVEFFRVQSTGGTSKLGEATTPTGGVYSFPVQVTENDNGTHKFSAKALDAKSNAGIAEVSVVVDIDDTKPSVSLSADKPNVTSAGNVTLTATATDNVGVTKVEFLKGSDKIGEDTEAPYTLGLSFSAASNGNHTYTAKAYDAKGNFNASTALTITVDIDIKNPTVSLSATPASTTQPGPVVLTADANDDRGVSKVEFYQTGNATPIHTDSDGSNGFKHELNFTAGQNGTHKYTAKAFDAQGNNATSAEVSVVVDIDATNPTISLSADKSSLSAPGSITLTAEAQDNKGVVKVEFFKNGNKLDEGVLAGNKYTFSVNYATSYKGKDSFSAKAFDASGNVGTSNTAEVNIDFDITNPEVSLTSNPQKLSLPGTVTLTAVSSDNQAVTKLEFFQVGNPTPLKTVTNPAPSETYSLIYNHENNGSYFFTAKAYDAKGNSTETAVLTVVVEVKPEITALGADVGYSLNVSDAGGFTHLKWGGSYVVDYHLSVSPDNTAWVDRPWPDNTTGRVYTHANYTGQPRIYTLTVKGTAYGSGIPEAERHVTLTVAADTTAPSVGLSSSSNTVTTAGSITLTATATDSLTNGDGFNVQKVEFFKGNTLVYTDTSSPYQYTPPTFSAADNGTHTYTIKATDYNGNSKTSDPVTITVNIN